MKLKLKKRNLQDILTVLLLTSLCLLDSDGLNNNIITVLVIGSSLLLLGFRAMNNHGNLTIRMHPLYGFILAFVGFCYLSLIWASSSFLVLIRANAIVKILISIMTIYITYENEESVSNYMLNMMRAGYIVVLGAILYYGFGNLIRMALADKRLDTSYLNPNSLAMITDNAIIINFYMALKKKERGWLIFVPLAILIVAVCGSRKGLLLLVGGLFADVIMANFNNKNFLKSMRKTLIAILAMGLILFILSLTPLFSAVNYRMKLTLNYLTGEGHVNYSTLVRAELTKLGIELFREHPIIGVGIDNARLFARASMTISKEYYLHNNYVELLADGGIIGFSLFYSMYAYVLYFMIIYRKKIGDEGYNLCLILILLHLILQFAHVAYYSKTTYIYLTLYFLEVDKLRRKKCRIQ